MVKVFYQIYSCNMRDVRTMSMTDRCDFKFSFRGGQKTDPPLMPSGPGSVGQRYQVCSGFTLSDKISLCVGFLS